MKQLIRWKEKEVYTFTNHQIEQLKLTDKFNQNHIAKVLIGHIDALKVIVDNLLEQNENWKTSLNSISDMRD